MLVAISWKASEYVALWGLYRGILSAVKKGALKVTREVVESVFPGVLLSVS